MEDDIVFSRTRRLNKKRKNKRWLVILIGILVVFLLSVISAPIISQIMFSEDEATEETTDNPVDDHTDEEDLNDLAEDEPVEDNTNDETAADEVTGEDETDTEDRDASDSETTDAPKNPDDYDLTFVESTEDNVLSSYQADWDAVPTTQAEPHTISFEQETKDWEEMLQAATLATGIESEAMQYLWVSGNGPNKVSATFTDRATQEHFRVLIEWVESEGYTPTRVDLLIEHDQMSRFSSQPESQNDEQANDASESSDSAENNLE
ncbi:hypothetical protein HMI01_07310 [Halolactibacillus miurensis]|uniref:DUF1510 domain-containing protein n=1 Tax=Halolactibacillus miurensis TaxID=306541 RepID=A0A1I6PMP3_9BACI|nr:MULTISPECIES: YrrS family protein [Halolactibacillus]GEM03743.1 hypothetical protein HMI01_07310 [Halolactibacillus miurensis]SFS41462.1 Protein of unknown function [Halolactibacillus miurensis]